MSVKWRNAGLSEEAGLPPAVLSAGASDARLPAADAWVASDGAGQLIRVRT